MSSNVGIINADTVGQIEFERSKIWGFIMNKYAECEDGDELTMDDLENFKGENVEDEEDFSSGAEAEEVGASEDEDVLQDITNKSRNANGLSILPTNQSVKESLSSPLIQDFLNQTRPILEEHERKWKEAGLDRVLNSFDPDKIEEKVGGWLRRRRSSSLCDSPPRQTIQRCRRMHRPSFSKHELCQSGSDADTEAESMNSVDTARYIRASKRCNNRKRFGSASTVTIKTYCKRAMHQQQIYNKLGVSYPDDLHYEEPYNLHHIPLPPYHIPYWQGVRHSSKIRQRLFSGVCNSSISSPEEYDGQTGFYPHVNKHDHRAYPKDHHHHYQLTHYPYSPKAYNLPAKRFFDTNAELRPCRLESECRCRNDVKLCADYRHVVNSSTEEWVVEDCNLPLQKLPNPVEHRRVKSLGHFNDALKSNTYTEKVKTCAKEIRVVESNMKKGDTKKKGVDTKEPKKRVSKNDVKTEEKINVAKKKSQLKASKTVKKTKTLPKETRKTKVDEDLLNDNSHDSYDSSFEKQLKKAIELSKETFKTEKDPNRMAMIECREEIGNDSENADMEKLSELPSVDRVKSGAKAKHLPKPRRKTTSTSSDSWCETAKPYVRKTLRMHQPKISPQRAHTPLTLRAESNEDTFFNNPNVICNSTAVRNNSAMKREFGYLQNTHRNKKSAVGLFTGNNLEEKKEETTSKSISSISSTNRSILRNSSTPSSSSKPRNSRNPHQTNASHNNGNDNDDNDCTLVSSTTGESQRQNAQQQTRETPKGILLYAPNEKALTSANISNNGSFYLTEEILSEAIGEQAARKFFKYYVGRRYFDSKSTVYYRPPQNSIPESDTESDKDELEYVGHYGDLYESMDKGKSK